MITKFKYFYLYLLISLIELLIAIFPNHLDNVRLITKPLLMITLMGWVIDNLGLKKAKSILWILFFAWLGDVFLMFSAPLYFPLGLGSFLVMQILYISSFIKPIRLYHIHWIKDSLVALIFGCYVFFFLKILWGGIESPLKIPVVLYSVSLGSMAFFAYLRKAYDEKRNFWIVFLGSIFFVLSDSLLAYNKFVFSFSGNSFAVMCTYILAQLLLSLGLVNFAIRNR